MTQSRQHDLEIFQACQVIFSRNDLRELVNTVYGQYKYKGAQISGLGDLIEFLTLEANQFFEPELAEQNERLATYLSIFRDFLQNNFYAGGQMEDGDTLYLFKTEENSSETEAFLSEFQMVAMDVENGYKDYSKKVGGSLKI